MSSRDTEYGYPQYPHAEGMKKWLHVLKYITGKSYIRDRNGERTETPRPLALRSERARLLGEAREARRTKNTEALQNTLTEAAKYEEIADQFINRQQDLKIDMGELGQQSASYVILKLENHADKEHPQDSEPPIFLIPGIASDIEGSGKLGQELAAQGRTVIILSYPDSWHGRVTSQFAEAVGKTPGYKTHGDFFEKMILTLLEKQFPNSSPGKPDVAVELWGYSTGATIVAELLRRKNFQDLTKKAVLNCPASCADQPVYHVFGQEIPMPLQIMKDYLRDLARLKYFAGLNPSNPTTVTKSWKARDRQVASYNELRKHVLHKFDWWTGVKVQEGGEITMISTDKDSITRSKEVQDQVAMENPNIRVVNIPGTHATPITEPKKIIALV